ncbi:hypothetical protein BD560DRAFT_135980 [Blakeslea trispora]|nr:hypothetical protein BD560DRAFT_135980 [Blakeslea trispora]
MTSENVDPLDAVQHDLVVNQVYDSISAIREAAIVYAKQHKFAVSTLRSSPRQLVLVCKHSGQQRTSRKQPDLVRHRPSQKIACPFEIRAKPTADQNWIVYQIQKEHNHEMATDIKSYVQHRRLTGERKEQAIRLIVAGLSNTAIVNQLTSEGIQTLIKKDIINLRQAYHKQQQQ